MIKPAKTQYFKTGSRVILKKKIDFWSETRVFKRTPKEQTADSGIPPQVQEVIDKLETYVTRFKDINSTLNSCILFSNRLASVISKIGKVTQKDRSKLIGLMARDVLEEFEKDATGWASYKALQKEDQKTVTKRLSSSVTAEVTNYFVDVQVVILILALPFC